MGALRRRRPRRNDSSNTHLPPRSAQNAPPKRLLPTRTRNLSRSKRHSPTTPTSPPPRILAPRARNRAHLAQIPRVEGWRALFKGLGPNLIGVVPARAINFWAYGNGKRVYSNLFFHGRETASVHLLAAATAGIITGTATNPIWLVKTRLQLDKQNAGPGGKGRLYRNAWDCVRKTVRTEGVRGLYRGLSASYLGVSESTLQWVLYEQAKHSLSRRETELALSGRQPTLWDRTVELSGKVTAAGGAKFVAALITYPHEVVRTRLRQAPVDASGRVKYSGLINCFVTIFKQEGVSALYGGLIPHMLRVVPSAAIMFGVYEGVLKGFGESSAV